MYAVCMRSHRIATGLIVVVFLSSVASAAFADAHEGGGSEPSAGVDTGEGAAPGGRQSGGWHAWKGGKDRAARRHARLESLELTDEQRKAIDELPEAKAAWRREHEDELQRIRDELVAARSEGDMATVQRLVAERQKLMMTQPGMMKILDEDQKEKFRAEAAPRGRGPGPARGPSIQAIQRQIRAADRAGDTERASELRAQLREYKQAVRESRAREAAKGRAEPQDDTSAD